ncbi:hypothetical protein [Devosia equisanguinis]|uniref:hypothetical protein n=1 Tax=Devosia equisanguinis TaxID=2490941 RepID=UPI000F7F863F|nr:hypothetical protein [Devosia equisanguinis]
MSELSELDRPPRYTTALPGSRARHHRFHSKDEQHEADPHDSKPEQIGNTDLRGARMDWD